MRLFLLLLAATVLCVEICLSQEKASSNPPGGVARCSGPLQVLATGTWRWIDENDTNLVVTADLSADGSWRWSVHDGDPRTPQDTQAGTWFLHQHVLVLRVENSKSDKIPPKLAMVFDIKSASAQSLTFTNTAFTRSGEMIWTRSAQTNGAATWSQSVRAETNRTSAAAGSRRSP